MNNGCRYTDHVVKEYESIASDHSRAVVSMAPVADQTCDVTAGDLQYHIYHTSSLTWQKKLVLIYLFYLD